LADDFEENFLQHVNIIAQVKEGAPAGLGLLVEYFDIKATASKKRIGDALKEGAKIPGAASKEKKNLQIK
jgi:hypothetical protein